MSIWNISVFIKTSKGAVEISLKWDIGGSLKKRSGKKPKLSQRDRWQIVSMISL